MQRMANDNYINFIYFQKAFDIIHSCKLLRPITVSPSAYSSPSNSSADFFCPVGTSNICNICSTIWCPPIMWNVSTTFQPPNTHEKNNEEFNGAFSIEPSLLLACAPTPTRKTLQSYRQKFASQINKYTPYLWSWMWPVCKASTLTIEMHWNPGQGKWGGTETNKMEKNNDWKQINCGEDGQRQTWKEFEDALCARTDHCTLTVVPVWYSTSFIP